MMEAAEKAEVATEVEGMVEAGKVAVSPPT